MRLYVSASRLNRDGVCTTIRSDDDELESVLLVGDYNVTAQEACVESAKILRDAAEKFEELAKEPDDKILKTVTHQELNGKKEPAANTRGEIQMIDPKFKDVKAGDWIWTIEWEWEKVRSICPDCSPIKTQLSGYMFNGFRKDWDKHPSAWTYNPFDLNDKPPCKFKVGEVIAVRDCSADQWKYHEFAAIDRAGEFKFGTKLTWWKYGRKLNAEEKGV